MLFFTAALPPGRPLAARTCCTFSPTTFSSVQFSPGIPYHTMGVLPSTQPVAALGSSFILSSFDMVWYGRGLWLARVVCLLVGVAEGGAGGGGMLILVLC